MKVFRKERSLQRRTSGADPLVCSRPLGRLFALVQKGRRGRRPRTRGSAPLFGASLIEAIFEAVSMLQAGGLRHDDVLTITAQATRYSNRSNSNCGRVYRRKLDPQLIAAVRASLDCSDSDGFLNGLIF